MPLPLKHLESTAAQLNMTHQQVHPNLHFYLLETFNLSLPVPRRGPETKKQVTNAKAVPRPYLEEGEVAVPIDAGNLQIPHDDLAVLVELLQGAVLLVQVGQSAEFVLRAGTHWKTETEKKLGSLWRQFEVKFELHVQS